MAITLASTTSSQKELEHAVGDDWRDPAKIESEAPATEPETAAATEPAGETNGDKQEKKGKGGFQKKIDRLTKTVAELRAELDAARTPAKPLAEQSAETEPVVAAGKEPKIGDFRSVDEYMEAKTEWLISQKLEQRQQLEQRKAEEQNTKEVFDAYNQRVAEVEAEHDDFKEVVGRQDIQIPQSVQLAIFEMENGPEVAYYLGQNPEECEKLCEMSPFRAVIEIGRIADKITGPASAAPAKQKTNPPPPIRPVGGNASTSSVPLDQLSPVDYIKVRRQQIREKRSRY